MSKFKVGDRIIRITASSTMTITKLGDVGTVLEETTSGGRPYVSFDRESLGKLHINVEYYELEAIYNSPLYKALR